MPFAVPCAIGLAITTLAAWRRQFFALAVTYWGLILGLGLTEDPTQTQRFVIGTSLLAILAAIGICLPLRLVGFVLGLPRVVTGVVAGVIVATIVGWNANYLVTAAFRWDRYGTSNGLVATELAYYLRSLGPGYTVQYFAPPRMWYYGFNTLPYIARGAAGIDVERPLPPNAEPIAVTGPTVFAFLPERISELEQVRRWYPNGEVREFRDPNNHPLFTVYRVDRR
jgi:hypothetical protein